MHEFANRGYGFSIRLEKIGSNSTVESDSRVEFWTIRALSRCDEVSDSQIGSIMRGIVCHLMS